VFDSLPLAGRVREGVIRVKNKIVFYHPPPTPPVKGGEKTQNPSLCERGFGFSV
jgi:hypothetical protein